jgi:hypothetical protein
MSRQTLEDRVEAWPDQWKQARTRYAEAKALVAKVELQLERARERAERANKPGVDEIGLLASTAGIAEADRGLLQIEHEMQLATFDVERAKATADIAARDKAQAVGQKLTEAAVEAHVKSDAGYVASQQKLFDAKHQFAVAKLERDEQVRHQREQERMARVEDTGEEIESEETMQLRVEFVEALQQFEQARTELGFQQRVGRTLKMLVDVLHADSMAAGIPALAHR